MPYGLADTASSHHFCKMATYNIAKIAAATVMTLCSTASHGQTPVHDRLDVSGGIKAEATLSGFYFSEMQGVAIRNVMGGGATLGGFVDMGITSQFSIQCELLMHYKSSDIILNGTGNGIRYFGMEIPVYAIWRWPVCKSRISAGIGPYTEFGLSARMKSPVGTRNLYEGTESDDGLPIFDDSNTGFALIVGYEFNSGVQINVAYKASITNMLDAYSDKVGVHPHALSVGIGYRFGK